jgi:hypothetical protein
MLWAMLKEWPCLKKKSLLISGHYDHIGLAKEGLMEIL